MQWFDVDKEGLSKLLEKRGKSFAVLELIQNCWDQLVTIVSVTIKPVPNRPLARLVVVDDDPQGFADLAHAYTLFAESGKKGDPGKRGRFNLGALPRVQGCARQGRVLCPIQRGRRDA